MNEEYIISKIRELYPDEKHIPQGVLYAKLKTAIQKDVSKTLSNLFQNGKVEYSKTLNDILIIIPNE